MLFRVRGYYNGTPMAASAALSERLLWPFSLGSSPTSGPAVLWVRKRRDFVTPEEQLSYCSRERHSSGRL